jgi:hypothetical protein
MLSCCLCTQNICYREFPSLWTSFADKLEVLGLEPMLTVLQKLGLSSNSVPPSGQPFDWLLTVGQAQRMLGLNVMVGFWVSQDVRNTSRNLMVVSDNPYTLPTCTLGSQGSCVSVVTLLWDGQSTV